METIREQIDRIRGIEEKLNENTSFAFDDEIKYELQRYLKNTIHGKTNQTEERAIALMRTQKPFIEAFRNKMSANEIAQRLYKSELDNLKRTSNY